MAVHPCLSLTLGPSGHRAHLKWLDDGLMTLLRLILGSNRVRRSEQPSSHDQGTWHPLGPRLLRDGGVHTLEPSSDVG